MDAQTPHPMTRAVPGDKRCAECGMTAGTKAHRAGREAEAQQALAQQALAQREAEAQQAPAVDQGAQQAPTRWVVKGTDHTVAHPSQVDIVRGSVVKAGTHVPAPAVPAVGIGDLPHVIVEQLAGWTLADLTRDVARFGGDAVEAYAAGDVALATRMTVQGIRRSIAIMVRTSGAGAGRIPDVFRSAVLAALAGDQGAVPAPADVPAGNPDVATSANEIDHVDQVDHVPAPAGVQEETTMQAVVKRADLVAALTYAVKGVPSRPSVPALAGIVLTVAGDTLTAHTFDWDTFRAGDVPAVETAAGTAAVGGRTLLASVKAMKAKTVTVYATAGELTVSAGDVETVTLPLFPREDMPAVPEGAHVIGTMDAGTMARLVDAVAVAAGTDETVPMMTHVRVRTDKASIDFAATDRFRLHTVAGTWSPAADDGGFLVAPGSEYLVPAKLFSQVTGLFARRAVKAPATVTITAGASVGRHAYEMYGVECDGFRMITRTYTDTEYPPVDGLFPTAPAGTVTVSAGDLVDKITMVSGGAKPTDTLPVILVTDIDAGTITLEYWADDAGRPSGVATMPATYAGTVPDEIGLRALYTVDALAGFVTGAGDTVTLEFVTATKPMVITGSAVAGARNLVMPIRISGMPDHAFKVSATDETRCDVMGCTGDRTARVHTRAARRTAGTVPAAVPAAEVPAPAVESVDQAASDSDAVSVPAPAVELSGPIVARIDDVKLSGGTAVVASGGTFGYIARAMRRRGTDGFDVMTGGQFTTHYAASSLSPAVVGATVCEKPYLSCACAGRMHLPASDLRRLPRLAGDDGASSPAVEAPAPAVPTDHPFTLPSHLVATYEALYAVALTAGFQPKTLWTRAGTGQTADDKWTSSDSVTLQIGTRDGYHGDGKSHVVVSWHSWNDVVTVQPGASLHTIDQVRDYLAGYMDAVTTCRFASDGLERIYRAVTGNHNPYGDPLPSRPFSAVPAPGDFERYADELAGCVCPLCVALVDAVDSDQGRDDAALSLFTALYGTHKAPTHVRTVVDQGALSAPALAAVPAVETVESADQGVRVELPAVWELPAGRGVRPMKETRVTVQRRAVTVVGPVNYEPSMIRVRTEDGTVHRALKEHVTLTDQAGENEAPQQAVEAPASAGQGARVSDQGTPDSVPAEAPAGEAVDTDTADKVRAMIAGATWSYGTGHAGKGRGRKAIRGPMMMPKLDGYVPRDVWTALADTVHALGGGAWMADVKAFAVQSSDVGTPWSKGHRSTQERAADYLAETAPASVAPAAPTLAAVPAVEVPASVDQGERASDQGTSDSDAVSVPAAPVGESPAPAVAEAASAQTGGRKRDPKRALRSLVTRLTQPGTVTSVDIDDATGRVSVKGSRPSDDQVSKIMGESYRFVERVAGIVGHYDRFMPVASRVVDQVPLCGHRSEHKDGATCTRPAGHLPANIHGDDSGAHWFPYGVRADGTVDPGTSPEFAVRIAGEDSDQDAPAVVPAVEVPASVDQGERASDQGTSDRDAVSVPAVGATYSAGPGHPLAVDASKPVTVTLVYADAPAAPALAAVPAVEVPAPAVDQVPALAGDVTHGAHAQMVHVSGAGDMAGYRFHLVEGVGCRQFAKPVRRALADRFGRDAFSVTTPSGSGAVNVAARGEVADWPSALALVAGIIGDKISADSATCAACDRSHALADH